MGRIQVFEWFSKLKSGMTSIEDAGCSGHPLTRKTGENVDQLKGNLLLETEESLLLKL